MLDSQAKEKTAMPRDPFDFTNIDDLPEELQKALRSEEEELRRCIALRMQDGQQSGLNGLPHREKRGARA